ncbi:MULTISPECIES: hypothetical protein [unclassified Bradyrhizobium]|uniref:hypothetical protein n=1 Tax=unclassified Bradyrhizobium TaxID=2631580 RepID=UPI001FF8C99B|nr:MULTISPECIES: hypothetical protein [unclassified Bradyrhizobium]MCK1711870.1 DUF1049 domain-containing protein [Bradyrhizobium sp. 143]MCK1725542.1 DUF1049 domain-containing protein [Bradyrhizobium sp. 142]
MRWVHLAVIVLLAAVTVIFAAQNLETVTISFFKMNVSLPLAVHTIVVYLLGAVTGGSLFALLRRSYAGSRRSVG